MLFAATRDRDLTVKRDPYEAQRVGWYVILDAEKVSQWS